MNKTTKTWLLGALLAVFALSAAAADVPVKSAWMVPPPAIDGAPTDWLNPGYVNVAGGDVGYAFANDAKNLYVLLVIRDPKAKSTIDKTGVTLYFDEAKKNKAYGILFHKVMIKPDEYIARLEKQGPVSDEIKAQIKSKPGYYLYAHEVKGASPEGAPAPDSPVQLPVYKIGTQGPMLVYEFLIPLERPASTQAGLASAPGKTIFVGLEYGGMTPDMARANARATGSANIAGGDNINNVVGSTGNKASAKKYIFWSQVQLASE
ncbi:MAG: hypothetical protein PHI34_02475 [Acidobacteriota bacterium]|nr:hypothetical protein [Acidobacteriota bacterium]